MKYTWEETDIVTGRIVGLSRDRERWMIGYQFNDVGVVTYGLVSLSDGLVCKFQSKEETARELTTFGYAPAEYLPTVFRSQE